MNLSRRHLQIVEEVGDRAFLAALNVPHTEGAWAALQQGYRIRKAELARESQQMGLYDFLPDEG